MTAVDAVHKMMSRFDHETADTSTAGDAVGNNIASTMIHYVSCAPVVGALVGGGIQAWEGRSEGKKSAIVAGTASVVLGVAAAASFFAAPALFWPLVKANVLVQGVGAGKDFLDACIYGAAAVYDKLTER